MAPTTTDASTAQKMTNGGVDNSGRTRDYSTLSNADVICAHFMDLDLEVDFAKKSIFGNVTYSLSAEKWRKAQGGGSQLPQYVLDTNGGLSVSAVEAAFVSADVRSSSVSTFGPVPWKLLPSPHAVFGRSLHISLSEELEEQVVAGGEGSVAPIAGDVVLVRITYATSSEAMACQWVSPESTSGKKYPYLFTQCQAIHARSLLPCQDCPSAKCAYRAKIRAPSWSQTLMSAVLVETKTLENAELSKKEFTFAQKVPVPSYLIAIVCGDIVSSKISDRVDVWSEPKDIEKVAYEFAETEEFLQIQVSLINGVATMFFLCHLVFPMVAWRTRV
ncbi:unnamed protein product [Amoebophrya sp. A25]|nr:unnamed protein product [Amoebophrya sp. A25]|eukprot:GSA25T00006610001.1